ncbi:MAG: RNA 2'-phosphotransferase [bacterium]|nr:RNA 2'-phosphotransferase [bacterium]
MIQSRSAVRISKLLSLMLRHRPDEFGLEVDAFGFADVEAVLSALQAKDGEVTMEDVEAVVYDGEKQRFEIKDGRIRARYGHSFPIDLGVDPAEPPEFLYKGVSPKEVEGILSEGLTPIDRQFVHLSFESEVAAQIGGGRGRPSAVIRVAAQEAHEAGVAFFDCGPTVLTEQVPTEFLTLEQRPEREAYPPAPTPPPANEAVASQEVTYGRRRRFSSRR